MGGRKAVNMNRIPIWLVEEDVGGGLPAERRYSHSFLGECFGYVVMPADMRGSRYADHIRFEWVSGPDGRRELVASLSTRRVVEAAILGEFGLSWEGR
jgi:hypothetical protein